MNTLELQLINELISQTNKTIIEKCEHFDTIKKTFKLTENNAEIINIQNKHIKEQEEHIGWQKETIIYWQEKTNFYHNLYHKWFRTYQLPFIIRLKFLFNPFCITNEVLDKYCKE